MMTVTVYSSDSLCLCFILLLTIPNMVPCYKFLYKLTVERLRWNKNRGNLYRNK